MASFSSSFTSSSNSTSITSAESSAFSSPCPSPPPSTQSGQSKVAVPFLWEEKPGISKPLTHSSANSNAKPSTINYRLNFPYSRSLEYPPLPPPPRLSQAFLSQPRSRGSRDSSPAKLLPAPSFSGRKPNSFSFKKPSPKDAVDGDDDPFFLALKACTTDNKSGRKEKTGYDGLQAAVKGLFKSTKTDQRSKVVSTVRHQTNEDRDNHYREVAGSKLQTIVRFSGLKARRRADRGFEPPAPQREDEQGSNEATVVKKAHLHCDGASKNLCKADVGAKQKTREGEALQVAACNSSEAMGEAELQGLNKRKARVSAKMVQSSHISGVMQEQSGEVTARPNLSNLVECSPDKVVDIANMNVNRHSNSGICADLLGCRSAVCSSLIKYGPAIHPSFDIFPRKLFSSHHQCR